MNKFYRKPKPETMRKNREEFKTLYAEEISWLKFTILEEKTLLKELLFLLKQIISTELSISL